MDADRVTQLVLKWAETNDPAFYAQLNRDCDFARGIFAIDRGGNKPRKDLAKWSDAPEYAAYFFEDSFQPEYTLPDNIAPQDAAAVLTAYKGVYDPSQDKQEWFQTIKNLCPALGFCPEVKEYKKNPEGYKGHAGDVSTVIRIAVTGRRNTPDLCAIMQLLGQDTVTKRLDAAIAAWS